jgi:glycosyltransferase involved in cell wall biosynthesis
MPSVTVVVPCFNEQATILRLLEALVNQTYPNEKMDVIISDGKSTDNTRSIISTFIGTHPDLKLIVIDNPGGSIPSALNAALDKAQGDIIVRLDAHSVPFSDYIERSITAHQQGLGDNIGGVWQIEAGEDKWIARSIAAAAAHPLGAGDAQYRLTPNPRFVDTVPFGSFRKELIGRIGRFDETLLTNEDYEFNARVRLGGGKVWLDPSIRSIYYSRSSIPQLARQYARYGFWKWRMLQRYPSTLRWRQALPPIFVLSLILLSVLSLWLTLFRYALAFLAGVYFLILGLAGLNLALNQKKAYLVIGFPVAIVTMHTAWGLGFLWSVISSLVHTTKHG